jgi:hypothetical protein
MSPPEDAVQQYLTPWWVKDDRGSPDRGRLLWAYVPYAGQEPRRLVSEGRVEPREHDRINYRTEPFRYGDALPPAGLPAAGLPQRPGEEHLVFVAKPRPVLVISEGGPAIERSLRTGGARWQTAPTLLVAPYSGVDRDGTRGGWPQPFVQRIRRAEFPQYMWDSLPLGGADESVLRLDHVFPIGRNAANFRVTVHRLSPKAIGVLDEWVRWLLTGELPDSDFAYVRSQVLAMP